MSGNDTATLTTVQASKLLLIGAERVRQLVKDGWIPQAKRNEIPLVPAVQGYLRFLKDKERRSSKSAADSRLKDIKAEQAEFDLAVAKKAYLPAEDLEMAMDVVSGVVKSEMLNLGPRLTRDPEERQRMDDEIIAALNRISEKIAGAGEIALAGSSLPENPDADEPERMGQEE